MNLLCNSLVTKELELQVFHKKISDGKYLTQESILIGTLFIDASALVQNPSRTSLTGYYHIFKNPRDKEINDYSYTHSVTMGQAKVTLEVDRPLVPQAGNEEYKNVPVFTMNEVLQDRDFERENIDDASEEEADGLKRAMRKAQELRKRRMDEEGKVAGSRVGRHMSPVTDRIQEYDENLDSNLHNASIQELKVKNMQNFKELDDLTTRLKTTFLMKKDDLDDVDNNDDLARATGQSANFELDM